MSLAECGSILSTAEIGRQYVLTAKDWGTNFLLRLAPLSFLLLLLSLTIIAPPEKFIYDLMKKRRAIKYN